MARRSGAEGWTGMRDENVIGEGGHRERVAAGVRGGVDHAERGAERRHPVEQPLETVGVSREDVGVFEAGVLTEVVPVAGAALGVDVEEDGSVSGLFREGGDRAGQGGLASAALLREHSEYRRPGGLDGHWRHAGNRCTCSLRTSRWRRRIHNSTGYQSS